MSWLSKGLKAIGKVALPAVGTALLGPLGGVAGGALAGAIGSGKPKLSNIVGGAAGGALGGAGGTVGKIAGGLKAIAPAALGGLSLYEGYKNDKKANDLAKKQLALAEQSYGERAPLRALGRDLMLNQTPPDLSYIYANSSNPFAKRGS